MCYTVEVCEKGSPLKFEVIENRLEINLIKIVRDRRECLAEKETGYTKIYNEYCHISL